MKTTAIDIETGAVRDDVEAEKGYNHEVDVEEYQRYLMIQEASMGNYQDDEPQEWWEDPDYLEPTADAETLVVESKSMGHIGWSPDFVAEPPNHSAMLNQQLSARPIDHNEAAFLKAKAEEKAAHDASRQWAQELLNTIQGALDAATNNCMTLTQYETSLDALYELFQLVNK